jgi:hypothetical protein
VAKLSQIDRTISFLQVECRPGAGATAVAGNLLSLPPVPTLTPIGVDSTDLTPCMLLTHVSAVNRPPT